MSLPLRVPLEVLERILSFTFAPLGSPSSSSPITSKDLVAPPLETSHLLLISRGFRRLALPLYYRIVAIVSPLDWPTFLHPEMGLLVGEDNEERTSFVKELWINVAEEGQIPIEDWYLQDALEEDEQPDRILIQLERATLPNLHLLHLFLCSAAQSTSGTEYVGRSQVDAGEIWRKVVDERLSDEFWEHGGGSELCEAGEEVWGTEWEEFLTQGIQELYQETDLPSPDELEEQLSSEREDALSLFLDSDFPPRRVEITLDGLSEDLLLKLDYLELFSTSDHPFVIVPPTGLDLEIEEDEETVVISFGNELEQLAFASKHSLLFDGFPRSFWELVRAENEPDVFEEGWDWKNGDGTVVNLKKTFELKHEEV